MTCRERRASPPPKAGVPTSPMLRRAFEPWSEARQPTELLFSACALALAPRSRDALHPTKLGTAPEFDKELRIGFRSAGLSARSRQLLLAAGLRIDASPQPGREERCGREQELRKLADSAEDLGCLNAAHTAQMRPALAPLLMGILNVTPDSFSDAGAWIGHAAALAHAEKLLAAGAGILDVGGESTRPGSEPVPAHEEIRRTAPLIRALAQLTETPISIDTTKAEVARAALEAGASLVNDISAGRFDAGMLDLVAEWDAELVLMHIHETPKTMQEAPHYADPVDTVFEHLRGRVAAGLKAGVPLRRMVLDPGIGFGKRLNDNILLMKSLGELRSLGLPVLVGASRKSMLGSLSSQGDASLRDPETIAAQCYAQSHGAELHRVHNVHACHAALSVHAALAGLRAPSAAPTQGKA